MPGWVENAAGAVEGVPGVEVNMVFDPPWTPVFGRGEVAVGVVSSSRNDRGERFAPATIELRRRSHCMMWTILRDPGSTSTVRSPRTT